MNYKRLRLFFIDIFPPNSYYQFFGQGINLRFLEKPYSY